MRALNQPRSRKVRLAAAILDLDCLLAETFTANISLASAAFHNSASLPPNAQSSSLLQALVPGVRRNLLHLHAVNPYLCTILGALTATFVLGMQSTTTQAGIRCPLPAADLLAR